MKKTQITPTPAKPQQDGKPMVPKVNKIPKSNYDFTGGRGRNFGTGFLQSDNKTAACICMQSKANIYRTCENLEQLMTVNFTQRSRKTHTEYAGTIYENILGHRNVTIMTNNVNAINTQMELVKGDHTHNVGNCQQITVDGDYESSITKGNRVCQISANLIEKVDSKKVRIVDGKSKETKGGVKDMWDKPHFEAEVSSDREITFGFQRKATASVEAVGVLGASFSLSFGIKTKTTFGGTLDLFGGLEIAGKFGTEKKTATTLINEEYTRKDIISTNITEKEPLNLSISKKQINKSRLRLIG